MTSHSFTSHNRNFVIEGNGFMHARADFDEIAERVEAALDAMPTDEVATLHAAAISDAENDVFDGPAAIAIDEIVRKAKVEVTNSWHDANGCGVSLVAVP